MAQMPVTLEDGPDAAVHKGFAPTRPRREEGIRKFKGWSQSSGVAGFQQRDRGGAPFKAAVDPQGGR